MKSKRALMTLLLLLLTACIDLTDPYDRIQGEPSEDGVAVAGMAEGEAEENATPTDPEHEDEAAGAEEEH